jgi:hypothetical protein
VAGLYEGRYTVHAAPRRLGGLDGQLRVRALACKEGRALSTDTSLSVTTLSEVVSVAPALMHIACRKPDKLTISLDLYSRPECEGSSEYRDTSVMPHDHLRLAVGQMTVTWCGRMQGAVAVQAAAAAALQAGQVAAAAAPPAPPRR